MHGDTVEIEAPVLVGLDGGPSCETFPGGRPTIGVICASNTSLSPLALQQADRFALIVAGSTWAESVLRANGVAATTTVLQGVDTSIFHPAPRSGQFPGRFVIFSGGELEHRNGQDLMARAFEAFQERHKEALLVTAWDADVDTAAWAIARGVPADSLVALTAVPNIAMPHVLREVDVAVFPSRCESGTNPVAMACMACGVPVILSANTGHLDLLRNGTAFALKRQAPVAGMDGWGESDVEEIGETLETVWSDRRRASGTAARGAAFMASVTWDRQTDLLLRAIDPLLP
jgi:glycosyltransferase involved in cell wall biosynthesis